jgi:V/A-type H+-transporting ATPase subunit A
MEGIGLIERIAGSVVVASHMKGTQMNELVRVGEEGLIGEVIRLEGDTVTVQVYEETTGIRPGEKVERMRRPLSVELGPGMVGQTYDGIQRPLNVIKQITGDFISRGISVDALDRKKKWRFLPVVKKGQTLQGCDILGTVQETVLVAQKIMVPPNLSGTLKMIEPEGEYTVADKIADLETPKGVVPLCLMHSWPVRKARPIKRKVASDTLLVTGQRIIDCFFPIAVGGVAVIPGGFGTGKTIMQHQLAQWAQDRKSVV